MSDALEVVGVLVEEHRGGFYTVRVGAPLNKDVLCRMSGKMALHRIRVLPGDTLTVELGAYDLTRGRITFRGLRGTRGAA